MTNILITGGAGFIGHNLVLKLLKDGYNVMSLDIEKNFNNLMFESSYHPEYKYISGSILDKELVGQMIKDTDIVIHCAVGNVLLKSVRTLFKINVDGTLNLLKNALKQKVKLFIFFSTGCVYGIQEKLPITELSKRYPLEPYGWSKFYAEALCHNFRNKGLNVVIIRPPNVFGKGRLGVMSILFDWIKDNKRIYIIGNGSNKLQFLSMEDLYKAIRKIIELNCKNEDFNLGTDKFSTVFQDLLQFFKIIGSKSKIESVPSVVAKSSLVILDKFNLSPLTSWHYLSADHSFYFDTTKAKEILGWQPEYSNVDMLVEAYQWFLQNQTINNKNELGYHVGRSDCREGFNNSTFVNQKILKLLKFIS